MTIKLKSGREIDANSGLISINDALEVGTGYDQMLSLLDEDYDESPLTAEERVELADRMITLWQRWKQELHTR